MTHVMINLETLGTTPGSVVLSIGAVVFDPFTGKFGGSFRMNIDRISSEAAGLTVDPATVAWWAKQDQAAKDALLVNPRPVDEVLSVFSNWWEQTGASYFWAHAPNFDETLLTAVYRAVGRKPPWKFWDVRCTRTAYSLAGDIGPNRAVGQHHNALDDAKAQALAVHEAYKILGLAEAV